MLIGNPFGEAAQPADGDRILLAVEKVGAVNMDALPVAVHRVMGIPTDVGAPIDHMHRMAGLGAFASDNGSGEAGANHEDPQVGHQKRPKSESYGDAPVGQPEDSLVMVRDWSQRSGMPLPTRAMASRQSPGWVRISPTRNARDTTATSSGVSG